MGGASVAVSSVSGEGGSLVLSPPSVSGVAAAPPVAGRGSTVRRLPWLHRPSPAVAPPPVAGRGSTARRRPWLHCPSSAVVTEGGLAPWTALSSTGDVPGFLRRTASMDELEARYRGHVLLVTAVGVGSSAVMPLRFWRPWRIIAASCRQRRRGGPHSNPSVHRNPGSRDA
ncbi:uncharacterized protein [Triticum aestivum]|uniref:uncharacterized protein n=1 Tax=Triticum aestivum TaxID=4565 RepID=UPI001D02923B|nr:uncharacterized protein LOC123097776 [Triticum aestivum]